MVENTDLNDQYRETLTNLKFAEDNLEEEIGNLQHELRRVKDGIERVGSSSHSLEREAKRLLNNIGLCERDLIKNRNRQSELSEQLDTLKSASDD